MWRPRRRKMPTMAETFIEMNDHWSKWVDRNIHLHCHWEQFTIKCTWKAFIYHIIEEVEQSLNIWDASVVTSITFKYEIYVSCKAIYGPVSWWWVDFWKDLEVYIMKKSHNTDLNLCLNDIVDLCVRHEEALVWCPSWTTWKIELMLRFRPDWMKPLFQCCLFLN